MKTKDKSPNLYIVINGRSNQFKRYNVHNKYFFNSDYIFFVTFLGYDKSKFLYFVLIE